MRRNWLIEADFGAEYGVPDASLSPIWSVPPTGERFKRHVWNSCLAACQCRVDQAMVLHATFVLLSFIPSQQFRRFPKETLGLQMQVFTGGFQPPAPLKGKVPLSHLTA